MIYGKIIEGIFLFVVISFITIIVKKSVISAIDFDWKIIFQQNDET